MLAKRLSIPFDDGLVSIPTEGKIAVYRARPEIDYPFPKDRMYVSQGFKPLYESLISRGFNADFDPADGFSLSLVHLTRSKLESLGLVAEALTNSKTGSSVLVDGAKTDGVESVLKKLRAVLPIAGSFSKSHGKIFWIERPKTLPQKIADWSAGLKPTHKSHGFLTAPGMFSPDKIDEGSELLASEIAGRLKGNVADLGAGWGWLSVQALKQDTVKCVDLFEAEKSASEAARLNTSDSRARFFWEDVLTMTPGQTYDAVLCNPPFHQGRAADPDIGRGFIEKAAQILGPGGSLYLVANRQLPYEDIINNCFQHANVLTATNRFKVIHAEKPLHYRKSGSKPVKLR